MRKSYNWLLRGVRNTNCRGRLARSGTVAGSFWQLANILTIRVLQICERRTRINISPAKKLTYLFGLPLAKLATEPFGGPFWYDYPWYDYPCYGYYDDNAGDYSDGQSSPGEVTPSLQTIVAVQKELTQLGTATGPSMVESAHKRNRRFAGFNPSTSYPSPGKSTVRH